VIDAEAGGEKLIRGGRSCDGRMGKKTPARGLNSGHVRGKGEKARRPKKRFPGQGQGGGKNLRKVILDPGKE